MNDQIPEDTVLPCGCFMSFSIVDGVKTMTVSPCKQSCEYYHYLLHEMEEQQKPVEYKYL